MLVLRIGNLFARRSIRSFTGEPVEPAQVEMLLEAAMVVQAPLAIAPCGDPSLSVACRWQRR